MQVLTYYQPHATLSAIGAKTVETRAMDTKHRGWTAMVSDCAIHRRISEGDAMSETRLSAERLAEIREVAGSFGAIADLLDDLDAVTRERDDYKRR